MNGCDLVRVKVKLLKWWLFLMKILRRNMTSFNLLPCFGIWNLANCWQNLKTWNNSLIFLRWKTCYVNISLISLASKCLKACTALSLNLPKLLYKRSSTLLLVMMKLSQLIISLGIMFMHMLFMTFKGCHSCWIWRKWLVEVMLITWPNWLII